METHPQYVTYAWLIGSLISMLGIVVVILIAWSGTKVNKDTCIVRHDNLDKGIEAIRVHSELISSKVEEMNNGLIRIEVMLNRKHDIS